jgi:hypothetical protein
LGDMRHDADVPLWWVGLVAACVSARACLRCDGSGERGASRHVRGSARWTCENVKHRGCVIRATWNARLGCSLSARRRCLERSEQGVVPQYCDCGFVLLRVRRGTAFRCGCCVTAQRCVGLFWRLIARVCVCRCAAYTRALPPRCSGGVVLRVWCGWRRRRSLADYVAH